MSQQAFHFAIASDGNTDYLLGLTVCMVSALRHLDRAYRPVVHILDLNVPDDAYAVCEACIRKSHEDVEVVRHRLCQEELEGFPRWRGSLAAINRLFLPSLLPEVDWILYVDCDVLFTEDPSTLLDCRDSMAWIVGHAEEKSPWTKHNVHDWLDARGYTGKKDDFVNSGFLLMNLEAFRREGLHQRCFDFLTRHPDVPLCDQTTINIVCRGHIHHLPNRWGLFHTQIATPLVCHRGAIHFAGTAPWVSLRDPRYPDAAAAQEWLRVMRSIQGLPQQWVAGLPSERAFFWRKALPRWLWRHLPRALIAPPWLTPLRRAKRLWRRCAEPIPLDLR